MKKLKLTMLFIALMSLCSLIMLLNYTSPSANGPFGILAVFVFMYFFSFSLMSFVLFFCSYAANRISVLFMARRPIERLIFSHSCYYSAIIAVAPVMIVGLRSVGSAGFYGYLLVFMFVLVGLLYVSKKI